MLTNCLTYYSLCYGTNSVEELLQEVRNKGYSTFALTDINNTSACLDTVRLSKEYGLKPALGIDFRNGVSQQYVGIARNNFGFRELNEHLSTHLHSGIKFGEIAPELHNAFIIYPAETYRGWPLRDNEFVGIPIRMLSKLAFLPNLQKQKTRWVAMQETVFSGKKQYNAHRLLRSIDTNVLLSKLSPDQQAPYFEPMLTFHEMRKTYAAYPHIIDNTQGLLADCHIHFEYGKLANKNLRYYTTHAASDMQLLRKTCEEGLKYRYPKPNQEVFSRMEKELDIIGQMNFASYFLINWDIIRYAQHKNYYYIGRGSGANSLVAYLLRITDVDPIELELYFERFINQFRSNAPDFDLDFSWTDRDDITRYIFERFGYHRTALLGSYNTFQHDAVIRELGKVFGLPAQEIDQLQRPDRYPNVDQTGKLVLRYTELIKGYPNHLSIHSSGILISEEPISSYSATFLPPKGFPTTQFSMLEAEDIGLFKFDILSQRGLGKIKDSLELIEQNKKIKIDIHDIDRFKKDILVRDLLRQGKAIGCFYIESPAMRTLLTKLQADDYLRLVAASSIIRPGVSRSGMMRAYIERYRNPDLRKKAHDALPELYDILHETYGVMVYQEDVIRVAHEFADLSLAEADHLRRGMSWKFKQRNEFGLVRQHFFDNCKKKGYPDKLINEIWLQIESFANYAFSKGHSASYAVESFQALYLKAYYPLEYMVATLNNGGGFYRRSLYVHEARMHGGEIEIPCINKSQSLCSIEERKIYLGLNFVAELEEALIRKILNERSRNGNFIDLPDFIRRVAIGIEQARILIRIGAFRFTGRSKKELLWEIHSLIHPKDKNKAQKMLFIPETKTWQLPKLHHSRIEQAYDEIELLGFSLCSPFDLLKEVPEEALRAKDLPKLIGKTISIAAYLITVKITFTHKGDRMCFGTFIDIDGEWVDTVHFPPALKAYPFRGMGCYLIKGKVINEYDAISIDASYIKRLEMVDREKAIQLEKI
ncbi:MAG: DNA polymerase III subunit alpha [Saprospiraceae bacterium]|nr:DNA polymerase III subunit alpha [Saprospiraceae bacterium]